MTIRPTRRWFTAIPITGRFYIMFGVLVLAVGGIVFGALRATQLQSDAGSELARVAAVQRSLDRALTIHTTVALTSPSGSAPGGGDLVNALRAQLEATWSLPATPEIMAITDSLRVPASQYFQGIENQRRESTDASGTSAWAFADVEPRRAALETSLKDAMTRMRAI